MDLGQVIGHGKKAMIHDFHYANTPIPTPIINLFWIPLVLLLPHSTFPLCLLDGCFMVAGWLLALMEHLFHQLYSPVGMPFSSSTSSKQISSAIKDGSAAYFFGAAHPVSNPGNFGTKTMGIV